MPSESTPGQLQQAAVNTIRMLAADAVERARSGHPGMPMGAAAMAYVLWQRFLRFNPDNPSWPDRDRFVLSAGHGSALLYALLHLTGYDVSLDDLREFRQWGSSTPGHPEYGETPGVETTTGPLGQGFGNAVGMAIAETRLAADFNRGSHRVIDHRTFVIASDGDLMEGVSSEAASLAGHLGLNKLVVLYDDNSITIDGNADLSFSEDVPRRFQAYGWNTQVVEDGNDCELLAAALERACGQQDGPSLIAVRTRIGFGSPGKENSSAAHGEPLGAEELVRTKANLGWPTDASFHVPEDVREHFRAPGQRGARLEQEWRDRLQAYATAHPAAALELQRRLSGELPQGWADSLPDFEPGAAAIATRAASGKVLNSLAGSVPELMGGSADLAPSNKTIIAGSPDFSRTERTGRNLRFGIREHAMGSVMNGLALHGGVRPYGGTFLVFSDYMRPAIRLAALMGLPTLYVFTHDSIAVGEDGPTHQPVEQLAALRSIPGLVVIRPADANETREAWRVAMEQAGPVAIVLSRQSLPVLDLPAGGGDLSRGAYVAAEAAVGVPDLILIASGSEVPLALAAREILGAEGHATRVVSMPSWELFERQDRAYRDTVLPPAVGPRLAVEAACAMGWCRYTGERGDILSMDRYGASAPGSVAMAKFGFTPENVARRARALLPSG